MKTISLFKFNVWLLGFIILFGLLTTSSKAQYTWQYIENFDNVMGLYDAQHFVVEDGNRKYKYTADGGTTLLNLGLPISSPRRLSTVEYLSPTEMMALVFTGSSFEFHKSTDGGATFSPAVNVLSPGMAPLNIPQMVFFDNMEGVVYDKVSYKSDLIPVLFKTTDGGASWNLATADTFAFEDAYDMEIYRAGHIVVASNLPQGIEISTDRGATFTSLASLPPITSGIRMAYDGQQNIWATNIAGSQNANCYVSADGGNSWNPWTAVPDGDDVQFTQPSNLLIFGSADTTALSTDGGSTFSTVHFPATKPVGSLLRIRTGGDQQTFYVMDGTARLWILTNSPGIGMEELTTANPIHLYPNPAHDQLTIQGYQGEARIYTLNGQLSQKLMVDDQAIDISSLTPGLYFIELENSRVKFLKH